MNVMIVIPVFNEERQLSSSIARLVDFLGQHKTWDKEVVIADNGSADRTLEKAHSLAKEYEFIRVVHLEEKGRGRALKTAWSVSSAEILSYMDVDLSTDLVAFPGLIDAIERRGYDLAVGSRLLPDSDVRRGWKREFISRSYNRLIKSIFQTRFSDAQCGFKAITRAAARSLLPLVEDTGWFFDTELLVLAERLGYRIFDLPVRWDDDSDSRVKIIRTAWEDVKGLMRMRRNFAEGRYSRPADQMSQ
jgi:glycosyltransferase involved in cell wall biosynthesis